MWWNKYINIPFSFHGRDTNGIDCWGLARLIYKDEFNIELPSFAEEYIADDTVRIKDLIAQYKEGWELTTEPKVGDLVLFKILGSETHIGVYIGNDKFIHARQGHSSAIERLDSVAWRSRKVGFFKYKEKTNASLSVAPHPLRTEKVMLPIKEGSSLADLTKSVKETCDIPKELQDCIKLLVNGKVIPESEHSTTIVKDKDVIEYRAVPTGGGGGLLRTILTIAVIYVSVTYGADFGAFMGFTGTQAAAFGSAAISMAGMMAVNAIAPIRPPEYDMGGYGGGGRDAGSAQRQLLQNGGTNQANKYEAIPVVLGKVRITAPLGAQTFVESNNDSSDLNMLLVWGFGPLQVSDLRIGPTSITQYENGIGRPIEYVTLSGANLQDTENAADVAMFDSIYGKDVQQDYQNIKLVNNAIDGAPWTESTLLQENVTSLGVTFHFPEGLRTLQTKEVGAGNVSNKTCELYIQYRPLDNSGNPLADWAPITTISSPALSVDIVPAVLIEYAGLSDDGGVNTNNTQYYRWHRIGLSASGTLIVKYGAFTENKDSEPSINLLNRQKSSTYGYAVSASHKRLPDFASNELPLYDICMRGLDLIQTDISARLTDYSYAGFGISNNVPTITYRDIEGNETTTLLNGRRFYIATGQIAKNVEYIILGNDSYVQRKDAFSFNRRINVPSGKYQVRVKRANLDTVEEGNYRYMHQVYLESVTGYSNTVPVINPPNCKLAKTALRIRATDQLNGQIEGINAIVQTLCYDWDSVGQVWIPRASNNPASLFLYILKHPANAHRVRDADVLNKINLQSFQDWHEFCSDLNLTYNAVVSGQRSIMDVLKDIAAAGRASPAMIDGKWNVIIDKPRTDIVQHFTPHNSWGFESTKAIPIRPHGLKVTFNNELKGYQEEELIVYNTGKDANNSEIFEQITLPGTTNPYQAFIHARWQLAQSVLRPELYSLNTDMEYLICNRGDRVKVLHDVPMWGLGSGRIKTRVSGTEFELDEELYIESTKTYTLRVRASNGDSIVRTLAPVATTGYYTTITVTVSTTTAEANVDDLFMFGELAAESNDLVVISVEPFGNNNAKISLVDYAAEMYNIDYMSANFTVPDFDSKITVSPKNLIDTIIKTPTISSIISDETVMEQVAAGVFKYNIKVNFSNPTGLPSKVAFVQGQIDLADDTVDNWTSLIHVSHTSNSISFADVQQGSRYKIRLRYVSQDGRPGPWVTIASHLVTGKTNPPSQVTGLTAIVQNAGYKLDWNDSPELDVIDYEVRDSDTGWGDNLRLFKGDASTCSVVAGTANVPKTWYVRALDSSGNYSTTSATITKTANSPINISSVDYLFADTSLTNASITLNWTDVVPEFGLNYYEVSYDAIVKTVKANTITLPADWIGNRNFTIKVVDLAGNKSTGLVTAITKLLPNTPTNFRTQVIDNTVMFYWTAPTKTTLPIDHFILKKGITWDTATLIGEKKGDFTTVNESQGGEYTYWLAAVDTDDNISVPVAISAKVAAPPDYVLHGEFISDMSGTKNNAVTQVNSTSVVLPVITSETWAEHFSTRAWTSPSDQVSNGYPIYIQPTNTSGYYEEVFDFGSILASSKVTLEYQGDVVSGTPVVISRISISPDGSTYTDYDGTTNIYGANFRYVKIRVTVTSPDGKSLYLLNSLSTRLDAKLINDAGTVAAVSTDTLGTIVNFNREFIDVQSVTLSAAGTTPITAVYDFVDSNLPATYSVTSNVGTISVNSHGLITGQKVRLQFATGSAISGVYQIVSHSTNAFTVNIVISDTSGDCLVYAESFRAYLFNSSGTRVSGNASWSIKGY